MEQESTNNQERGLELLNAIENAILDYGRKHRDVISNPYHWFADKLGYKAKNQIYFWFQKREHSLIKVEELLMIMKITKDQSLLEVFNKKAEDALR